MKRIALPVALSLAFLVTSCDGTNLPEATGKGNIRAINAIERSPDLGFFIEERFISNVSYKGSTSFAEYDDLNYNFNFDLLFAGDLDNTRIFTRNLDVVADQDYTFLISGSIAAPAITLWESTIRVFDANATIFQARFAHAANSLGNVDYYFAAEGVAPVLGDAVATLSFGQIADAIDFEAGSFVLIITASGDPNTVLFSSTASAFASQTDVIVTSFDGDLDDNAPVIVSALGSLGATTIMRDANFPATVEFLHASQDLGPTDIYDDAALSQLLLANHNFLDQAAEIPVTTGEHTFRYTPASDTSVVSVEGTFIAVNGLRYRFVVLGDSGTLATVAIQSDRRPIDTAVKVLMNQASRNFPSVDFYIVNADVLIDDELPFRGGLATGVISPAAGIAAGSYDIYVTSLGEKTILAGPLRVDVALGDVVDLFVFDTVDPAIVDLQILPTP